MRIKNLRILSAIILLVGMMGVTPVNAVDPLPPELENAPLEKQAEYWQRTSKESEREKLRVGQARYERAVQYKHELQQQMYDRTLQVQARIQGGSPEVSSATSPETEGSEPSSWPMILLIGSVIAGGFWLVTHQMKQAVQTA
ncbi:MAG: hypothetical protein FJ405_05360 [Verrucomicrobia bacterium]|nr:hypothetical protein [Verrucomicrobiota bacterium]